MLLSCRRPRSDRAYGVYDKCYRHAINALRTLDGEIGMQAANAFQDGRSVELVPQRRAYLAPSMLWSAALNELKRFRAGNVQPRLRVH